MLGTLRFFLASLVALSHVGWLPWGFNLGITAVVVFYMISGCVVSQLWFRLRSQPCPLKAFYIDRLLRIYPTYLFVLALGAMVYLLFRPESYYLAAGLGLESLVENLVIVPLNYFMYNHSDRFVFIPPAWSLAAEIQFYLLLPLLIRFPRAVFVCSLVIAVVGQMGWLPREWFTYRFLPGVLHVFMAGVLLGTARDRARTLFRVKWIWGVYAFALVLLVLTGQLFENRMPELYVSGMLNVIPEVLLGLLIGIPLLYVLAPLPGRSWDRRLGDFSYGVFLNHFIVYWCLTSWFGYANTGLFLLGSYVVAVVGWYLVERSAQKWRYALRQRQKDVAVKV